MCVQDAKGMLINITGGDDMTLFEVDAAANCIRQKASEDVNIIFGSTSNQDMNELALVQEIPLVILTPYLSR